MKTIPPGILEKAVERLKGEFQPEQIYLFGSHAWGSPQEDSDVDRTSARGGSNGMPFSRNHFPSRFAYSIRW